jgi:hypothetical protein
LKHPASLPWLLDAADRFGRVENPVFDDIYFEPAHVVFKPQQLPGGPQARVAPGVTPARESTSSTPTGTWQVARHSLWHWKILMIGCACRGLGSVDWVHVRAR